METRSETQQKAASASRAGGGSGNEETGPYGVATDPRPACERPGDLEVRRRPKEDHFGAEGGGGDYGRDRDERRGGKGKGKGPLGREESRSTPTPSPAPRPAPRNKDGLSGDVWEVLSEEECQVCFVCTCYKKCMKVCRSSCLSDHPSSNNGFQSPVFSPGFS